MQLREKGKKTGDPVTMSWDEAQAAIQSGTHVPVDDDDAGEKSKPSSAAKADDKK